MAEINHWSQACEIWYGGSSWTHYGILYKILFKVNSYKLWQILRLCWRKLM